MNPKLYECGQCGLASAWESTLKNHFSQSGHSPDSTDYHRTRQKTQAVARVLWGAAILGVSWWWWIRDFSHDNVAISLPVFAVLSALLIVWMVRPRKHRDDPEDTR